MTGLPERMIRSFGGVRPETPAEEAAELARSLGCSYLVVAEGDDLVGVLAVRTLAGVDPSTPVAMFLERAETIPAWTDLAEAEHALATTGAPFLAVMAGGLLLGVLDRRDVRHDERSPTVDDRPVVDDWGEIGPVS